MIGRVIDGFVPLDLENQMIKLIAIDLDGTSHGDKTLSRKY